MIDYIYYITGTFRDGGPIGPKGWLELAIKDAGDYMYVKSATKRRIGMYNIYDDHFTLIVISKQHLTNPTRNLRGIADRLLLLCSEVYEPRKRGTSLIKYKVTKVRELEV